MNSETVEVKPKELKKPENFDLKPKPIKPVKPKRRRRRRRIRDNSWQIKNPLTRIALSINAKKRPYVDKLEKDFDMEMEKFKALGLDLHDIHSERERKQVLPCLRAICRPMEVKMWIRDMAFSGPVKEVQGYKEYINRFKKSWGKFKSKCNDVLSVLEIWHSALHTIESLQGTGVLSFFIFLRWMLGLNILLSVLMWCFILLPMTSESVNSYVTSSNNTAINLSLVCTKVYSGAVVKGNHYIMQFFQGTGWMETNFWFFGSFSDRNLEDLSDGHTLSSYNISLAYVVVPPLCLMLCFVLMVNHTVNHFRKEVTDFSELSNCFCNSVFGSWDFSLNNAEMAMLKQKQITYNIQSDLREEKFARRQAWIMSNGREKAKLYSIRIGINLLVIGCLCLSGYLIYAVTVWSSNTSYHGADVNLSELTVHYLPPIVLTMLNAALPILFNYIVRFEKYRPSYVIKISMIRTVFLRLASLSVLVGSTFLTLTCAPKDQCGMGECAKIPCWETFVAQQLYKLMVVNFLVTVFKVLYYELPRRLITEKWSNKLMKKLGPCCFDIPENVLGLIYTQTIVWLGFYFAPFLPIFALLHFILIFYSKMLSALYACNQADKPYRASRDNNFFMFILLMAFFLFVGPVGYAVVVLKPSKGCGAFRTYDFIYNVFFESLDRSQEWFKDVLKWITSAGILFLLVLLLLLTVYHCIRYVLAYKAKSIYLMELLKLERLEKQFLLERLYELMELAKKAKVKEIGIQVALPYRIDVAEAKVTGDNTVKTVPSMRTNLSLPSVNSEKGFTASEEKITHAVT